MIYRRIIHIEAHRGYWPRVSLRREPQVGDVTPDGVLVGCETCSTSGYLAVDRCPRPVPKGEAMSEMPVPDVFTLPVVKCPSCGHGIDPHSPNRRCGVGDENGVLCPCMWTPNDIAGTLLANERAKVIAENNAILPATIAAEIDTSIADLRAKVKALYDSALEQHTDPNGSILTEYMDGEFNGALEAFKDVLALLEEKKK